MKFTRALFLSALIALGQAFAGDIEVQVEVGQDSAEEDDDGDDEITCGIFGTCWQSMTGFIGHGFEKLGTPEGATCIACIYGIMQGISNFMWAFDWEGMAGTSPRTNYILQEIGGLSAAAECFLMGALVPVMLYMYQKKHAIPVEEEETN